MSPAAPSSTKSANGIPPQWNTRFTRKQREWASVALDESSVEPLKLLRQDNKWASEIAPDVTTGSPTDYETRVMGFATNYGNMS
jgi:hypothetical protein